VGREEGYVVGDMRGLCNFLSLGETHFFLDDYGDEELAGLYAVKVWSCYFDQNS
jgi:hypothetical protein